MTIHKVIIPKSRKVNISLNVPEDCIGQEIEIFAFKRSAPVQQDRISDHLSPVLPGPPFTEKEFIEWVGNAEMMPTITLEEAKNRWAEKKLQLKKLIK